MTLKERVEALRRKLDEEQRAIQLQDEHLSGLERPYNPDDPTDPTRVFLDITFKREVLDRHVPKREFGWRSLTCSECAPWGSHRFPRDWPCWHVIRLLEMYGLNEET